MTTRWQRVAMYRTAQRLGHSVACYGRGRVAFAHTTDEANRKHEHINQLDPSDWAAELGVAL